MANIFALILTIATLATGVLWCLDKFIFAAKRREKAESQIVPEDKKNAAGWTESLASLFPVLLLVLVVRSFIYEPFQIPSGSMMPTLLVGDFILVEKFAYGLKDPIAQKTLIKTGHPKRGDIAVFKYPLDPSLDFIKRVIGLPGDRITYNPYSKELTVQPHCSSDDNCSSLSVNYSDVQPSDYVFTLPRVTEDENSQGFFLQPESETRPDSIRVNQRDETLGDVTHRILLIPNTEPQTAGYYQQPGQIPDSWVVPAGHYFMMGDNRDKSADSRYWGFVPEEKLVGKATIIWMSFKKREGEWPTGVRLNRIGFIH